MADRLGIGSSWGGFGSGKGGGGMPFALHDELEELAAEADPAPIPKRSAIPNGLVRGLSPPLALSLNSGEPLPRPGCEVVFFEVLAGSFSSSSDPRSSRQIGLTANLRNSCLPEGLDIFCGLVLVKPGLCSLRRDRIKVKSRYSHQMVATN